MKEIIELNDEQEIIELNDDHELIELNEQAKDFMCVHNLSLQNSNTLPTLVCLCFCFMHSPVWVWCSSEWFGDA